MVVVSRTAFVTVPTHPSLITGASSAPVDKAFVVALTTPESVPIIMVVIGGPSGVIATTVTKNGAVCGAPLNELGSGLVLTAVVVVKMKRLVE